MKDLKPTLKPRLNEQFLCDKLYLPIFICWAISPVYTSNFFVTSCICQFLFAGVSPVYTNNFYFITKDWRLGSIDGIKKIANFLCCLVYTDNFLYVSIFICHKKLTRQFFSKYNCPTKIG